MSLCKLLDSISSEPVFQPKWSTMRHFQYRMTLKLLLNLTPYLKSLGADEEKVDVDLWTLLLNVLFNLVLERKDPETNPFDG